MKYELLLIDYEEERLATERFERTFELATKQYPEIAKERVLMVGDSLSSDIQGGVNFGVDTCWFNPREKPAPAKPKPTYEIRRLSQLLEL